MKRRRAVERRGRVAERSRSYTATVLTTMRLRRSLRMDLDHVAAETGRSVADVAQQLLDEGLRMRRCPGIYFADEASGRTAKIAGTGLAVWEVLADFVKHEDQKALRKAFGHLSPAQLSAALMYYRRYPDEIRREVAENDALTPEVLERLYPGLITFPKAR